jgi:hypothetical protein
LYLRRNSSSGLCTFIFDETFVFLGTLCALAVLAAWRMRRRELPSAIPAAQ